MKPITKEEAKNNYYREGIIELNHKFALNEAIEKINTCINIQWDKLTKDKPIQTQPLINCVQYARLSKEIHEMYHANCFDVNLIPGTSVLEITLINEENEQTEQNA